MKNYVIPTLILIIIILAVFFYIEKLEHSHAKEKIVERNKFLAVLNDSLHIIKTKNGDLEYSKKSLQNNIKFLQENINTLSDNQKTLVNEIKNNKNIISAMQTKMEIALSNISNTHSTFVNDTTIRFSDSTAFLSYNIEISGIKASSNPDLTIKTLELPNKQTITFEWDNEKTHPVKGTVTNTNPYIKINELDSFIIPEIEKEKIKPTTWQKFKTLTNKTTSKLALVGIGAAIGFVLAIH